MKITFPKKKKKKEKKITFPIFCLAFSLGKIFNFIMTSFQKGISKIEKCLVEIRKVLAYTIQSE